jgi:hypothetical protein
MTQNDVNDQSVPAAIAYATPVARPGSPTVAATVLGVLGLGLVVLGGCFLIPMTMLVGAKNDDPPSAGAIFFFVVLYALAFTCFAFAAWIIFLSVKRLLQIMK